MPLFILMAEIQNKNARFVVVPGAAAVSKGKIPGIHFRARSRERLRPVGGPDPRETRMALHP